MAGHHYDSVVVNSGVVLNGNLSITNVCSNIADLPDARSPITNNEPDGSCLSKYVQAGNAIAQLYDNLSTQIPEVVDDISNFLDQTKANLDSYTAAFQAALHSGYIKPQNGGFILDPLTKTIDVWRSLYDIVNGQHQQIEPSLNESVKHNGMVKHHRDVMRLRDSLSRQLQCLNTSWQAFELPQKVELHQQMLSLQRLVSSEESVRKSSFSSSAISSTPQSPLSRSSTLVTKDATDSFMDVYRGSCIKWCPCRCHRQSLGLAMKFSPVLGILLMCMSGGKFSFQLHDCKRCKAQQPLRLKISYFVPMWLAAIALHVMMTIKSNTFRPQLQLRWSHVCSATSDLFKFAELGNTDGIKSLLKNCLAGIHDIAVSTGKTALHCAVIYNRKDTVKFLLTAGADPSQEDKQQDTPTNIAWERIYGKLADNDVSEAYQTMFTQDTDYFDNRNFNIYHKIVLTSNHSQLQSLLRLNETIGIDHQDANGRTPLSWAASRGDYKMTMLLLEAAADPEIQGRDGRTALHWAAQSTDPATLEVLIAHKADVHRLCSMERTALHYAACNHNDPRYIEILLAEGLNINARDRHDRTALGYAASKGHPLTTRCLLQHGADPALADNWNQCPLIEAARETHHETLRCLVQEKGDCLRWEAATNQGLGVLHVIAQHGNHETLMIAGRERCRILDWEARDRHGRTPLEIARKREGVDAKLLQAFKELSTKEVI